MLLLVLVLFAASSCATASSVPYNATPEQIDAVNAKNLEAIAKNTSILAGFQLGAVFVGALYAFLALGLLNF